MSGVVLPGGITPSAADLQPPSKELLALHQIAVNQKALSEILNGIVRLLEVQIRIQCGVDSRNYWKQRFMEADQKLNDDSTKSDGEGEEDYPQEYESLQEREDPDREAKRRGGYPSEGPLGD